MRDRWSVRLAWTVWIVASLAIWGAIFAVLAFLACHDENIAVGAIPPAIVNPSLEPNGGGSYVNRINGWTETATFRGHADRCHLLTAESPCHVTG